MFFEPNEDQAALFSELDRILGAEAAGWKATNDGVRYEWSQQTDSLLSENGFFDLATEPSLGTVAAAELTRRVATAPVVVEAAASAMLRPFIAPQLPRPFAVTIADPGCDAAPIPYLGKARTLVRVHEDRVEVAELSDAGVKEVESLYAYPMGVLTEPVACRPAEWTCETHSPLALWRVALAVELAGLLQGGLEAVLAHVRERRQFGRPLGSFQGIQHRLASASAKIDGAKLLALRAAQGLNDADAEEALGYAQTIARDISYDLHQFMGAMGVTLEHPLHRWTYRARWLRGAMGGGERAFARAATLRWG